MAELPKKRNGGLPVPRGKGPKEASMRAVVTNWASWCWRHWSISIAAGVIIALFAGLIPSAHEVLPELARRPDVKTAFTDPMFGKQDAMLFLFSFLFFGPFAGFIAFFFALFILGVLGGIFLPMGRRIGFPEWLSTALYMVLVCGFVYVERDVWMQPSLWFLGLVARSWMLVMS